MARRLGDVPETTVASWRSGARKPRAELRAKIELVFAVPEEAWDQTRPQPRASRREPAPCLPELRSLISRVDAALDVEHGARKRDIERLRGHILATARRWRDQLDRWGI